MNEAGGQEVEQNEGATEETQPPEQELEPVEEEPPNISNEITQEEINQNQEEEKPKKKEKALDKKVQCKKCDKEMTLKTYRYTHEKKCNGKLEEKPVKPQAKPKPKTMPTPRIATKPVVEKQPKPEPVIQQRNPVYDIREHYQILQNEYIRHKQEKYSNLCQNMFNSKTKKRR